MQRRAAAVFAAFFLLVGAASYSLIATAQQPHVEFENPEQTLQQNDTFSVGDRQYTVSEISASSGGGGGGGHGGGGGGGVTRAGQITWVNESAQYSATLQNNSTLVRGEQNTSYRVVIQNASDVSSFTLREDINESRILADDPQADDQLVTRNGSQFVVIEDGSGNATLVPASEYFPEPETQQFSEGDSFEYQSNQTTVSNVTNGSATLTWTAEKTNTIEASNDANVTIGEETYLAHFPDNETMLLTQDFQSFQRQNDRIDQFTTSKNGLWGIVILSGAAALLLLMMAYLPSRY
ncbi:hypothetical protein ACFO0N_08320 [Halobium salinum]|uniref:DUF4178 domain-containing protein n=1 Tax=Halobium salinum TaxID=1364940 RepID=A0ABD5PBV9_9EURY|nr:hypothetical protein [Halobium salinum]